jgi:signal transduction histidine kinase
VAKVVKFSPEGSRIMIRIAAAGDTHWRLKVEDHGIGIKPDDVPRLFGEFQRLDAGMSRRHEGSGLGLAITRQIVEALGGRVGVRSELDSAASSSPSSPA